MPHKKRDAALRTEAKKSGAICILSSTGQVSSDLFSFCFFCPLKKVTWTNSPRFFPRFITLNSLTFSGKTYQEKWACKSTASHPVTVSLSLPYIDILYISHSPSSIYSYLLILFFNHLFLIEKKTYFLNFLIISN